MAKYSSVTDSRPPPPPPPCPQCTRRMARRRARGGPRLLAAGDRQACHYPSTTPPPPTIPRMQTATNYFMRPSGKQNAHSVKDARRVRGGRGGRPCHVVAGRSSEFHQSAVFCWGFKAIKISPASDKFTVQCDCNVIIDGYFTHTPSPLLQDSRSLLSSCRNTSKLLRSLPAYTKKKKKNRKNRNIHASCFII